MKSTTEKRLQRGVSFICGIVFVAFAFTFLAVYQAPLMEILYDRVATGKLHYDNYVVAACVTAALCLLSLWLNRIAKFQREWTALAYLPASLLLAFIADIDRSMFVGGKSYTAWIVIFVLVILAYLFIAFILHRILFAKIKNYHMAGNRMVWRNMLLLSLIFMLTGTLSNGEVNFKNEAAAYIKYKHGDTEGALRVAEKTLDASQELTCARAFYLSLQGGLGDRLFRYPQYYGAEGLLPHLRQTSALSPDSVYVRLGVSRGPDEAAMDYLRRAAAVDSVSAVVSDYLLCALLLDKRITEFVTLLPRYYNLQAAAELPVHYKEALMLYADVTDDYELPFADEELSNRYSEMLKCEAEYDDPHIRSNYVRRAFGNTYWWYYNYGE